MNDLPLDESTKHLTYHSVRRGGQAIIRLEDSDAIIVVANPGDGRKPYVYFSEGVMNMNEVMGGINERDL